MAVDRRLAGYSGMRIDWPHLRSIESSVSHDFDMLGRGLVTGLNRPYLVRGFRLKIPSSATNASNLQIEVADSVVLHSSATESGTIFQVPAGTADESLNSQNSNVIGAFQSNAINYVSLDLRRVTDTNTLDQTAGWSPSQQLEFQRSVPIGRILKYRFIISTIGYSTNLPLYAVKTTVNGAVEYITKGVTSLFRLGSGGANPNPQNKFAWGNLINTQPGAEPRREWISPTIGDNPLTVRPGDSSLAFDYGDFAIKNLKDWMDAIMSRIQELANSDYWYTGSRINGQNLGDLAFDAINSVMTGAGQISYNLVLESSTPSDGQFQSVITDPTIQPGDVYVQGVASGVKATMTAFNQGRLLINSQTTGAFQYGEELWTRRRFRPDNSVFKTRDYSFFGLKRYASMFRPANGSVPNNILSWTYVNHNSPTGVAGWTVCTVTTTAAHGFNVGSMVSFIGLQSAAALAPDGAHRVLSVPAANQLVFATNFPQSGSATVIGSNGATASGPQRHPFSGLLKATNFQPGAGNLGLVTVPGHTFLPAQSMTGNFSIGNNVISAVSNIANLRVGMLIISASLTGGQGYITRLNNATSQMEVDVTASATITGGSFTAKQLAFISGLVATGHTTNQLDGVHAVESLGPNNELVIDMGFVVTGTSVTVNATAEYLYHSFAMSLSGANPIQFNVTDALSFAIAGESIQFPIGEDTLPNLGFAGGSLLYDGVIADSVVRDPVKITNITNDGSGNLTVTTAVPHGIITGGPQNFTIFGDSSLSIYIRSYQNITLVSIGGTPSYVIEQDAIAGSTVPPASGFPTGALTTLGYQGNNFVLASTTKLGKITVVGGSPVGTPTGNVLVDIYASAGNLPTGGVLATSDPVLASTLADNANKDFLFSGAGYPVLPPGNYCWVARGTTADSLNAARLKSTGTGPATYGQAVSSTNGGASYSTVTYSTYYQVWSEFGTSSTVFQILNTGIISSDTYTNPGTDKTFALFSDNPYAGPIQWDQDIVIKGIMGDLRFTIPQTATVDTTDPEVSPTANQFNVNGQTGTAYLQDGEVLFIKLKRGQQVSNGTIYSTAGAGASISTASIMTDENGDPLVPGDFIKFSDESDSYWIRIKTINATTVTLVSDRGQPPGIDQRPTKTGKLVYARGTYNKVYVKKHYLVDADASTYWLAVRRDNNGPKSKVYFRALEIEAGEVRQVNDNTTSNILTYTGAGTEAAINPNYTLIDQTGDYQATQNLTVDSVDNATRMVTFNVAPSLGFQQGDQIVYFDGTQFHYYDARYVVSSRTAIFEQDTSILAFGQIVTYRRVNKHILDQDNLTLAIRKEDRSLGTIDTALNRPVYDESVYIQQINLSGAGTVRSGSYIYKGPLSNPTAFAWVLHGNANVAESIEDALITMPGGHSTIGANAILVNIVFGSFLNGDGLFQNGSSTGRTVNNPSNPPFTAPPVYGDTVSGGVELVLPPNKRTQVKSPSGYVVFGMHSTYKGSLDPILAGEELLVIVNNESREASLDHEETFGGPKAKIRLVRTTPPNTRMRFRSLSTFGSSVVSASSDVTLQSAYNAGATIQTTAGRPVAITSDDVNAGNAGFINRGSMLLNGGASQLGGIFNESGDQTFVIGKEADKPKEVWTGLEAVKTHSSHPGSALKTKTAAQVVTGASGTVIAGSAVTLLANNAYRIKMNATARRSDGPVGSASFTLEGTFHHNGASAQVSGEPMSQINGFSFDGQNYAAAFGLSGNDVVLVVYGASGATVQWACSIEWQGVGVA